MALIPSLIKTMGVHRLKFCPPVSGSLTEVSQRCRNHKVFRFSPSTVCNMQWLTKKWHAKKWHTLCKMSSKLRNVDFGPKILQKNLSKKWHIFMNLVEHKMCHFLVAHCTSLSFKNSTCNIWYRYAAYLKSIINFLHTRRKLNLPDYTVWFIR